MRKCASIAVNAILTHTNWLCTPGHTRLARACQGTAANSVVLPSRTMVVASLTSVRTLIRLICVGAAILARGLPSLILVRTTATRCTACGAAGALESTSSALLASSSTGATATLVLVTGLTSVVANAIACHLSRKQLIFVDRTILANGLASRFMESARGALRAIHGAL